MNLGYQVTRPLVSLVSDLAPSPFEGRALHPETDPVLPAISREKIVAQAREEAVRRGWLAPAGSVFYSVEVGLYGVSFFEPGHDHGDGGLGNPRLYFDGQDGRLVGDDVPGSGSAGDIFLQAQYPLHSGRIVGLPGRIFISLMGLVVAMLSATGIIIWIRKRSFRRRKLPQAAA